MLAIRVGIVDSVTVRLAAAAGRIRPVMTRTMVDVMGDVYRRASEKLSGPVLRVRSGHLRRSLGPPTVQETPDGVAGTLGVRAVYARIHEQGGTIPAHDIVPRHGKVLRFPAPGFAGPMRRTKPGKLARRRTADAMIFATRVRIPQITMPARPFLRPSFEEALPGAKARMAEAILRELNGP